MKAVTVVSVLLVLCSTFIKLMFAKQVAFNYKKFLHVSRKFELFLFKISVNSLNSVRPLYSVESHIHVNAIVHS